MGFSEQPTGRVGNLGTGVTFTLGTSGYTQFFRRQRYYWRNRRRDE